MRRISFFAFSVMMLLLTASCNKLDYTVVAPTFKGFDYRVKDAASARTGIKPGDEIEVTCIRSSNGANVLKLHGNIYLLSIARFDDGRVVRDTLSKEVTSETNPTFDGWKDPWARFTTKQYTSESKLEKIEYRVACYLTFDVSGNQESSVVIPPSQCPVEPYIGKIYVVRCNAMNGGEISSGNGVDRDAMEFHTIYKRDYTE